MRWRVSACAGVYRTRASTICALVSVEGLTLHVRGLDAIDGTPVLDIKPVMRGFLPRGELREPGWAKELMKEYW